MAETRVREIAVAVALFIGAIALGARGTLQQKWLAYGERTSSPPLAPEGGYGSSLRAKEPGEVYKSPDAFGPGRNWDGTCMAESCAPLGLVAFQAAGCELAAGGAAIMEALTTATAWVRGLFSPAAAAASAPGVAAVAAKFGAANAQIFSRAAEIIESGKYSLIQISLGDQRAFALGEAVAEKLGPAGQV